MAITLKDSLTQDQILQNVANYNPEMANNAMDKLGYTKVEQRAPIGGAVLADGTVTQNGSTPISTTALQGATKYTLPQVKSTDANTNLGMRVTPATPTPETPATPKTAQQTALEQISSLAKTQGTQGEFQTQANNDAGLEQKRLASQALDKEAADTTLKYQAKIDELKQNRGGMIGQAFDDRLTQLESKKNQELANIAIRQKVAQGDITTALAIVKDKVDAKFEPIKNQIDTLKAHYSLLQNDMSESDKVKAQAEIRKQETAANNVQKTLSELSTNLLENSAPQSVSDAIDRISSDFTNGKITATEAQNQMYRAAGQYGVDVKRRLEVEEMRQKVQQTAQQLAGGGNSGDLVAYASDMASTGKLPSPAEVKASGLTVGKVAQMAREIPQPKGFIVSASTGVKDQKTPATEQQDFQRLYNITENIKRLKELDKARVGGVISGTLGKLFGSDAQSAYVTLRQSIVDDLSRMQSGAALTPDEVAFYQEYLPGRFSESFGLGQDSGKVIDNFESIMNNRLSERLASNGLQIYGYSTVDVGGHTYTVGDTIELEGGKKGRILPGGYVSTE